MLGWTPERFWNSTEEQLVLAIKQRRFEREDSLLNLLIAATHITEPILTIARSQWIGAKGIDKNWNDPMHMFETITGKAKRAIPKSDRKKPLPIHLNIKELTGLLKLAKVKKIEGDITVRDTQGVVYNVEKQIKLIESGKLQGEIDEWVSAQD